ncbi:MAG: hypothetical protein JST00_26900 [Deltaproteobacteria bacterium]|nr:hypothetical protein [Deltaproteobacteria bacterium]
MRWRMLVVLGPAAVAGVIAACNLNPQPLPPSDDNSADPGVGGGSSGGFRGDDEKETPAPTSTSDAGSSGNDGDSSVGGGDGGDGGDGGSDASDHDADAG